MHFQCSNELELVFQVLKTTVLLHLLCSACEVNILLSDKLALYFGCLLCITFSWLTLKVNLYLCDKNRTFIGYIYKQCWPICCISFLNTKK